MGQFIGHLHPALVHLPIGIIIMAIIYEWLKKTDSILLWGGAFFSSLLALATGIVLLNSGYFEGLNMFLHMIMGYLTVIITGLIYFLKRKEKKFFNAQNMILKAALLIIIQVGGHMGGELSHGENYLPNPLKSMTPMVATVDNEKPIGLYDDIIQPIFELKCNRCHETGDTRGKLNMQSKEGLLSDKYGDPAIAPGDLKNSSIYKRITMHPWEYKYMPPSGPDLTYGEKRIIEWWISSGASFEKNIEEMEVPDDIKALLMSEYLINLSEKSFYEEQNVPATDQGMLYEVKEAGYNVMPLAANTNFLDVHLKGQSPEVTTQKLDELLKIQEQLTWLDLSDSDLNDEKSLILSKFPNLTKLKVHNTDISDGTIAAISELQSLRVLNLYNTKVTDHSIEKLLSMDKLEEVYVWKTEMSEQGIAKLKKSKPELKIVSGANI